MCKEFVSRNREVLRAEDFTEADLEATAAAKVPDEYAHLDDEESKARHRKWHRAQGSRPG